VVLDLVEVLVYLALPLEYCYLFQHEGGQQTVEDWRHLLGEIMSLEVVQCRRGADIDQQGHFFGHLPDEW
jgi:hypothetical protein